jgi:hypothetical protein
MEQDNFSISWEALPWKKFERKAFRLQCKIYKAKQSNEKRVVKRFQKLLLYSRAVHYLAVRRVVSSFKPCSILSTEERIEVANRLASIILFRKGLNFSSSERSYATTNASLVLDKALQYVWRLVLEPVSNGTLSNFKVYKGFKNKVSQEKLNLPKLYKITDKKILKLTVDTSLKSISFSMLRHMVRLPLYHTLVLYRFLKRSSESLDPRFWRRSIIACDIKIFLVDVFLEGLENLIALSSGTFLTYLNGHLQPITEVLCTVREGEQEVSVILRLKRFLSQRGLNLDLKRTYFVSLRSGFEFSKFYFKTKNCRHISIGPLKLSWLKFKILFNRVLKKYPLSIDLKLECLHHLTLRWFRSNIYYSLSDLRFKNYLLKKRLHKYLRMSTSIYKEMRLLYVKSTIRVD